MHRNENVELYPLGEQALTVKFGHTVDSAIHQKVTRFAAALNSRPFAGMIEAVPAFNSVTVYYDPVLVSRKKAGSPLAAVERLVRERLASLLSGGDAGAESGRTVEIPVCYGGEYGPDLPFVAEHNGLDVQDVVSLHASAQYIVYMVGFAPGFPYLGGLPPAIAAPRKKEPRQLVPAGSVGIAGAQTGIYPLDTPGGWQLIGRTPLALFDPHADPPSLLRAGDRVLFVPVSEREFRALAGKETGR